MTPATRRGDVDLRRQGITVCGKGGQARIVRFGRDAARSLDWYPADAGPGPCIPRRGGRGRVNNREPLTASGIYQALPRRSGQCGSMCTRTGSGTTSAIPGWTGAGQKTADEPKGWSSSQNAPAFRASARGARARSTYDRIMDDSP